VHIVSPKTLRRAALSAKDAAREIEAWITVVKSVRWRNMVDLNHSFPDADYVKPYVIFNIRGNRYRLITKVYFIRLNPNGSQSEGHVYTRAFLTHKQYDDRNNWE
jgi:mRNA interferase HigB